MLGHSSEEGFMYSVPAHHFVVGDVVFTQRSDGIWDIQGKDTSLTKVDLRNGGTVHGTLSL